METKRLIETENSIQEFTVRFYGGTVMIEQNQLPLGQISCELLDYPTGELLALHDEAVRLFSIVRDSLFARDKEKSPALAAAVQCQLNRALKHVYPLPLFSLLNIDRDTYGTMLGGAVPECAGRVPESRDAGDAGKRSPQLLLREAVPAAG